MSQKDKNYDTAVKEVGERVREVTDLLLDAKDEMKIMRPHAAWRHLHDAKAQLEGAMVTAKWAQTLFPEDE
jgi:hypothetical protein